MAALNNRGIKVLEAVYCTANKAAQEIVYAAVDITTLPVAVDLQQQPVPPQTLGDVEDNAAGN